MVVVVAKAITMPKRPEQTAPAAAAGRATRRSVAATLAGQRLRGLLARAGLAALPQLPQATPLAGVAVAQAAPAQTPLQTACSVAGAAMAAVATSQDPCFITAQAVAAHRALPVQAAPLAQAALAMAATQQCLLAFQVPTRRAGGAADTTAELPFAEVGTASCTSGIRFNPPCFRPATIWTKEGTK